jgi:hypothetical protein
MVDGGYEPIYLQGMRTEIIEAPNATVARTLAPWACRLFNVGEEQWLAFESISDSVPFVNAGGVPVRSWRDVELFDECGEPLDEPARVGALREYRATGGIAGVWLVDPRDHEYPENEGPSVDEIDWTGFPE